MNETIKCIKSRRSIRVYEPEQLRDNELQAIVDAGLYAPSAMNQQSWHFTVLQSREIMDNITSDIKEAFKTSSNPRFQQLADDNNFKPFYNAPAAIIISGEEKAIAPNADCAAAAQNIMIAAQSLGIGSCWANMPIHVFNSSRAEHWKKQLGIPQGYKPLYSVLLGYKAVEKPEPAERKENTVNYVK